jgi:dienelactone hydrolase
VIRKWARACAATVCVVGVGGAGLAAPSGWSRALSVPVGARVFAFVDRSRVIRLADGRRVARPLETVVRYPATGGPYPLIVFGHGFALTPAPYTPLLRAWAEAGYVVAAPIFPLGNANAPGSPTESDLVNQPQDMSFVITRMLEMNRQPGVLAGKIDASRVAVAGHSDGAVTALAVAYDRRYRDPRVHAAIVLSGAMLGGMSGFPRRGPPLLAMQGTADPINAPATTASYFRLAPRPKFLLWLLGASHRPPYTDQQPQLGIVERTTIAFLDHYLRGGPLAAFDSAARRPGITRLVSEP